MSEYETSALFLLTAIAAGVWVLVGLAAVRLYQLGRVTSSVS